MSTPRSDERSEAIAAPLREVLSWSAESALAREVHDELAACSGRITTHLYGAAAGGEPSEVRGAVHALLDDLLAVLGSDHRPHEDRLPVAPTNPLHDLVDGLQDVLGTPRPEDLSDCELWEWLHLSRLRLSEPDATTVREAAGLSPGQDDGFVPACEAVGHPGWDGQDELAERLRGHLVDTPSAEYVNAAVELLALIGRMPHVHNGYQDGSLGDDLRPLSQEDLERYRARAVERAQEYIGAAEVKKNDFLMMLDEVLRSAVPVPLPAEDSWWSRQCDVLTNELRRLTGENGVETGGRERQLGDLLIAERGTLTDHTTEKVRLRTADRPRGTVLWQLRHGWAPSGGRPPRVVVAEPPR